MSNKKKPTNRLHQYLIICSIAVLFLYITVFDSNSFLNVIKAKVQNKKLTAEVRKVQAQNRVLIAKNTNLKNNPAEIEKTAREKVGMQKPGEIVYRFFKEKK